eukprot:8910625-Alexandrium_andersonii.AAC.1
MSASLVGSEMCIRDRHSSHPRQAKDRLAPFADPGAVPSCCPRRRGEGSVSYTHLTLPTICSV